MLNGNTRAALQGLHECGWVHRDISAGNIPITAGGEVKLSDWEYAKKLDSDDRLKHDIRTVSSSPVFGLRVNNCFVGDYRLYGRRGRLLQIYVFAEIDS